MEEEELREIVAASSYLKGMAEGEAKEKAETARLMLKDGEPIAKIIRYTSLSEAQIKAL